MYNKSEKISAINLAQFIVEKTDRNLFLTGKAGTGKTVFLKEIKEHTQKKAVVLAPTGIAAINAKAQTIHSFFKFSFSPYIPDTINVNTQDDLESGNVELLKELELIIIDEISMVRADLLDRIDHKLRCARNSEKPFGGIQLLLIGDLFQLPPVVTKKDKELLDGHYSSNYYFFNSKALKKVGFETICLDKVYRQSDDEFIKILDCARLGSLNWAYINKLNTRFLPDFDVDNDSRYITMVSLKRDADIINNSRLNSIEGNDKMYYASVTGKFTADAYPVPDKLCLKVGAQVMFTRNNYDVGYRNGTIGQVIKLDEDSIVVNVEGRNIKVERSSWENIEYTLEDEIRQIKEEVVGSFIQFPLKPAWAITVHKSQGLTFDKAVIDIPHTFESGQAYVAFSRCRTLNGIVLKHKVNPKTFFVDTTIINFYKEREKDLQTIAEHVSYSPFEWEDIIEDDNAVGIADSELSEALKKWRLAESRSKGLRAFQILTNRSLNEIATVKPNSLEQLGYINGVGLSTISRFGDDIINIVKGSYEHIQPIVNSSNPAVIQNTQTKKSWEVTYEMYCSGMSISEIADGRGLKDETIANHLMKYIDAGDLDAHEFVSDEILNEVRLFKLNNPESESLKDIFEALNGSVSYIVLRFALKCI